MKRITSLKKKTKNYHFSEEAKLFERISTIPLKQKHNYERPAHYLNEKRQKSNID